MKHTKRLSQQRQGFTLVEVLVAIVILLIGVVAALRIFPPGFNAYTETQLTDYAMKYLKDLQTDFEQNPNLPDEIRSPDPSWPPDFSFDDMTAIDYRSATNSWYSKHLFPIGTGEWPVWQPVSTRALRYVVGEQVPIPAEVSQLPGTAINVAFIPKYIPRFAPILPRGTWKTDVLNPYYAMDADPLAIYDIRYRRVSVEELEQIADDIAGGAKNYPDDCYMATGYGQEAVKPTFRFLPSTGTRMVRFNFYCLDDQGKLHQVNPNQPGNITDIKAAGATMTFTLEDGNTVSATVSTELTENNNPITKLTFPAGWMIVPDSEQLNRAYIHKSDMLSLGTGEYYVETPTSDDPAKMLFGPVYFSPKDAGKTVKMDYVIADWSVLHEDVTVNDDGYILLTMGVPKLKNVPIYPREPRTWGLYKPILERDTTASLASVGNDVYEWLNANARYRDSVMGLVDVHTGASYQLKYDPHKVLDDFQRNPSDSSQPYDAKYRYQAYKFFPLDAQPGSLPQVPVHPRLVDLSQVERGLIRVGAGTVETPDWDAFRGQTFRIYYRAQRDWTTQIFKAPAIFWYMQGTAPLEDMTTLGWNMFATDPADARRIAVPGVFEGQTVSVDYYYRDSHDSLVRVNGEVHTIPPRVTGKVVSIFTLRNTPEQKTPITVRGISVTIRTMWIQPRSGKALEINNGTLTERTISERWQSKSVTVILPLTKE